MPSQEEIYQKVSATLVEALNVDEDDIKPEATLQGDLGAESIDFLDIVFRLETEFGIKIPNEEVWAGAFQRGATDDAAIAEGVRRLRERMPSFRWDRLPAKISRADLPRLITINTIVDYLEPRLRTAGEESA